MRSNTTPARKRAGVVVGVLIRALFNDSGFVKLLPVGGKSAKLGNGDEVQRIVNWRDEGVTVPRHLPILESGKHPYQSTKQTDDYEQAKRVAESERQEREVIHCSISVLP